MHSWLPLAVFALVMGGLMILLARYQARKYQDYLARNTAINDQMRENQERLIAQQDRQAAILDRIATALEQRKP